MGGPGDPSDPGEQPDVDSRHEPATAEGASKGNVTNTGPGIGSSAWSDQQTTPVSEGATSGGPDPDHPHLFHLADWGGNVFPGGSLQGANSENWPLLAGQNGAVYLARLAVGGIREPHWHPSAWEVNVVLAGRVRWSFVGPNSTHDSFEACKGDVVFAPQGHFHYFENASDTEELVVLIVFNSDAAEPKDDIGLGQSLSSIPTDVLAAVFGAPQSLFDQIPQQSGRIVIAQRPANEPHTEGDSHD